MLSCRHFPGPHCAALRHASTALHFYQNKQLDLYASKEAKRLTLRQLVNSLSLISPFPAFFMHLTGILWALYGSRSTSEGCHAFQSP